MLCDFCSEKKRVDHLDGPPLYWKAAFSKVTTAASLESHAVLNMIGPGNFWFHSVSFMIHISKVSKYWFKKKTSSDYWSGSFCGVRAITIDPLNPFESKSASPSARRWCLRSSPGIRKWGSHSNCQVSRPTNNDLTIWQGNGELKSWLNDCAMWSGYLELALQVVHGPSSSHHPAVSPSLSQSPEWERPCDFRRPVPSPSLTHSTARGDHRWEKNAECQSFTKCADSVQMCTVAFLHTFGGFGPNKIRHTLWPCGNWFLPVEPVRWSGHNDSVSELPHWAPSRFLGAAWPNGIPMGFAWDPHGTQLLLSGPMVAQERGADFVFSFHHT